MALGLGIAGGTLGTAASQIMPWSPSAGKALAFCAAAAIGCVPVLSRGNRAKKIQDWTRLRSVSEALKNEVYLYLAKVTPYDTGNVQRTLLERSGRIRADAADLLGSTEGLLPVARRLPAVSDAASYAEVRLKGQLTGYYRPKAREMNRLLGRVQRVEILLGIAGALLAAAAGTWEVGQLAAWVAVTATVGAAVSAHSSAAKYAYQQTEFSRTADELQRILDTWELDRANGVQDDNAFVERCEHVISVLNDTWMVKWASDTESVLPDEGLQ